MMFVIPTLYYEMQYDTSKEEEEKKEISNILKYTATSYYKNVGVHYLR